MPFCRLTALSILCNMACYGSVESVRYILLSENLLQERIVGEAVARRDIEEKSSAILRSIETLLSETLDAQRPDKKLIRLAVLIYNNFAATAREFVVKIV